MADQGMVELPDARAAVITISTVPLGEDQDDDRVQVCINGQPIGRALWPSEAMVVIWWLESIEALEIAWTVERK